MFASIFAAHQPYITPEQVPPPTPAAPPAPTPSPQPPVAQPIAFSAVTRASLFGVTGSAIGSTTLATITCADASMTISMSEVVPGLTFSYAANVLTVAGTPTTPTGVHRLVVSYIASDGTNSVRGTTAHEITIVSASEVLTIGPMAGASLKVGRYFTAVMASPTTNYAVDVTASPQGRVPGCAASLIWSKGVGSGSGSLVFSGTPTEAGTYALAVNFYANGILLGTSTHAVVVAEAYSAASPAPAPSPAPSPPAPSAPPAPAPAPAPGVGPDPSISGVVTLMHFNAVPGIAYDERGRTFTNAGATLATGAVAEGAEFTGGNTAIRAALSQFDGVASGFSVECMADIGEAAWAALMATGDDVRFCPVVSYVTPTGVTLWALGFYSAPYYAQGNIAPIGRSVRALMYHYSAGMEIATGSAANSRITLNRRPARFVHIAGNVRSTAALYFEAYAWLDGTDSGGGMNSLRAAAIPNTQANTLQIGAACPQFRNTSNTQPLVNIVPFSGVLDELRITTPGRFNALQPGDGGLAQPIPATQRVIPWPNY